jgi:hypothetical protein
MATAGRALLLAAVWLSPAAILGLLDALLLDGMRGVFAPVALGGGAALAAIVLGGAWARLSTPGAATAVDLVRARWPGSGTAGWLALPGAGVSLLFVWAQLAAMCEVARAAGWPVPAVAGALALTLALTAWQRRAGRGLATLAGAVAVLGFGVALGAVMVATDPAWPRVFAAVAARAHPVFASDGAWVETGRPVRGPGPELVLRVTEEQRVVFLESGRVRIDLWEGVSSSPEIRPGAEVSLGPGDRLVVPAGLAVRFQGGRAVPGAPPSGAAWLDPGGTRADGRALAGFGLTLLAGALGLAPAHGAFRTRAGARGRPGAATALGAGLTVVGGGGVILWGLYAVWLTPEIYAGGVVPVEALELPARLGRLGPAADRVGALPVVALGAGAIAAGWSALEAIPHAGPGSGSVGGRAALLGLALGAGLAVVAPIASWSLLLLAFGLAASALAPAVVLTAWREGLSARAVAIGTAAGSVVFVALAVLGLAVPGGPAATSWVAWIAAWPAVLALPVNVVVVWLLAPPAAPAARGALPPDLAALHDEG